MSGFGSLRRQYDEDRYGTAAGAKLAARERLRMEREHQRRNAMTMAELHAAVRKLVPDAPRVDVTLGLQYHKPRTCRPDAETIEVLAEISVWYRGKYYGVDAPTYESALERFRVEMLPKMGLVDVAPAAERLAAMEAGAPCSTP